MRRKDRAVTSIEGMKDILESCKTCHVAMIDEGTPYIVPLSYGYKLDEEALTLYLHSAKVGRKIDILQKNNVVGFSIATEGEPVVSEVPCNSGYYFSSIVGTGEVVFIEEEKEKGEALSLMFERQTGQKMSFNENQVKSVLVYKLISKEFTGKRKSKPSK